MPNQTTRILNEGTITEIRDGAVVVEIREGGPRGPTGPQGPQGPDQTAFIIAMAVAL